MELLGEYEKGIVLSVIGELKDLINGAEPLDKGVGLCTNYLVQIKVIGLREELNSIIGRWPEYSGSEDFPIKASRICFTSTTEYYNASDSETMYDKNTKYGRARYRLAEHIHDGLVQLLKDSTIKVSK